MFFFPQSRALQMNLLSTYILKVCIEVQVALCCFHCIFKKYFLYFVLVLSFPNRRHIYILFRTLFSLAFKPRAHKIYKKSTNPNNLIDFEKEIYTIMKQLPKHKIYTITFIKRVNNTVLHTT